MQFPAGCQVLVLCLHFSPTFLFFFFFFSLLLLFVEGTCTKPTPIKKKRAKKKKRWKVGEQELCICPTHSFRELCPRRQTCPEPCRKHRARAVLAFFLPSPLLGQECVGFSSLMQIQPLEKLHSADYFCGVSSCSNRMTPQSWGGAGFCTNKGCF